MAVDEMESAAPITFAAETDRVYGSSARVTVADPQAGRRVVAPHVGDIGSFFFERRADDSTQGVRTQPRTASKSSWNRADWPPVWKFAVNVEFSIGVARLWV